MKLLFSLTYYTPYVSGLTLYVKRLAEKLNQKGYQSSVISFQHKENLKEQEIIKGVNVIRVKPQMKLSKGFISVDWIVKSFYEVRKTDVVLICLPQFEGFITALWCRFFRKKVVCIYLCDVVLSKGIINYLINRILDVGNILSLSMSDKIVTYANDYAANSTILSKFIYKTVYILPPIIKPEINKEKLKKFNQRMNGIFFKIGFIGRLATDKGLEYLIGAISHLKELFGKSKFKIILAGPRDSVGEEYYRKKIEKLINEYKEYILEIGKLEDDELGAFYKSINVLVLPSVNSTEAFGMVQVEAMLLGVPVIVSDLPGVRVPILLTKMGYLVPIKNSKLLAKTIYRLFHAKKSYLTNASEAGRIFSIENTIDQFITIINN
jgi:glycosyltransferase involved in cell wall biosynthesis